MLKRMMQHNEIEAIINRLKPRLQNYDPVSMRNAGRDECIDP